MNKSKIEWCNFSWNPIKGLCPIDCKTPDGKSYCYARKMYKRFGWNPEIRLDLNELMAPFPKKPSRIFVCSTFELFHPLAEPYRNNVFKHIEVSPEHAFIILTKLPQNIDRPMPDNVWLGVSIEGGRPIDGVHRIKELAKHKASIRFVSIEPLLGGIVGPFDIFDSSMDWYIVGRLTGHGHINDPSLLAIQLAVGKARGIKKPIFLKNNLKEIWGEPLIQEFPR